MTSAANDPNPIQGQAPSINPWIIAMVVVLPTFMEVLDTTIANVALRYIAGGLSASSNDSEWVITAYLAANATILPISGWLSNRLGRRNYFLLSIGVFTLASGLCGIASSLEELVLFRVIQGLAGGGLQPSSQSILLDAFPPEKQGSAITLFAMAALIAPVIGPTLGGYLTVNYEWRWIFYINVPVGLIGLLGCYLVVKDPPYIKKAKEDILRSPHTFDYIGLSLLTVAVCCWEVLLSKGQEWDWVGDPYGRSQALGIVFAISLLILVVHELRIPNPIVNFRALANRNFATCSIIVFCLYGVIYGTSTNLPGLLQTLFGYDALISGLVMSPAGIGSVLSLMVAGALLTKGMDARWLIAAGLVVTAAGNYWMAKMNLEMSPAQVIMPRVLSFIGISMIFTPLTVASMQGIPENIRAGAVGLFALLRNEGGSVGTSVAKIIEQRRLQFHSSRLNEFLDPLNPQVQQYIEQGRASLTAETGDPAGSDLMSLQTLANLRDQQADALSYFDAFWIFAALSLFLVVLVFFMRRSVAEEGAVLGGE